MAFLRTRAAVLAALVIFACGCKPKSVVKHNEATSETIEAIEALKRAAMPPEIALPDVGPPHLESVPPSARPSRRTGPLYLEKLPSSARPPHGLPRPPVPPETVRERPS